MEIESRPPITRCRNYENLIVLALITILRCRRFIAKEAGEKRLLLSSYLDIGKLIFRIFASVYF